ncbi:MAG: hypothetical protein GC196_08840 [Hyphomonas sp.]|nr:hypothetical protein [Hyphomonas sp.]
MKPFSWWAVPVGLAVCAAPFAAAAQVGGCNPALSNGAYAADVGPDTARMRCDLERASVIRDRAVSLYGARANSLIEIIDTASPSGAAYVYDVLAEGPKLRLEARSVPEGSGPRCRLLATLPDDTANALSLLLTQSAASDVPDYGPREDVTLNPDGSRNVRLVIKSHDIITRADTDNGPRNFSRHAGSDDPVSRLNNLVIGIANVSPGWVCNASS